VSWDEPGGYPFTGQAVPGVNGGTSPVCGFHAERGRACPDTAPGEAGARGSAHKRQKPQGAEYRRGACSRTGS